MALKINSSELGNLAGYGAKFCSPREAAEKFLEAQPTRSVQGLCERITGRPSGKRKMTLSMGTQTPSRSWKRHSKRQDREHWRHRWGAQVCLGRQACFHLHRRAEAVPRGHATRTKVFQNHGTRKEGSTLDQWCRETGKNAFKPTDSYTLHDSSTNVVVVGLIDGRTEDNELVEFKNRAGQGRLFNEVRDYEMAQCQAYLRMFNLERGFLVECLRQRRTRIQS